MCVEGGGRAAGRAAGMSDGIKKKGTTPLPPVVLRRLPAFSLGPHAGGSGCSVLSSLPFRKF